MKHICAWCQKDLGDAPGPSGLITHGICKTCSDNFLNDKSDSFQTFINSFHFPIVVVDSTGHVIKVNTPACELNCNAEHETKNSLPGEVINCVNAFEPGGCGKTIHCYTCTLRQSINQTFETGSCLRNVPAYKDVFVGENQQPVRFLITTEKIHDRVLVRIDDLQQ